MAAGRASHAGKAKVQIPAIHITVNHLPDIRPEKPVLALIAFFPDHFQVFEEILDALKVAGVLGVSGRVGIKEAMSRVLPQDPDVIPTPYYGALHTELLLPAIVSTVEDGAYGMDYQYLWWPEDQEACEKYTKMAPSAENIVTECIKLEGYLTD